MNSELLEEQMDEVRERLLVALDALPDEALLQPGTIGQWSVADTLAHLVVWEAELVTALARISGGKKPTRLLEALADVDAYNAERMQENSGRDLDRIFDDLIGVRRQLEIRLAQFSEKELTNPRQYSFLEGKPLWELIKANCYGHELKHLPAIETFSEAWLAAEEAAVGSIGLDDIEVISHDDVE
ncbi:MAG: DinB family protein [Anaerolineales bacterium]|nr:DinB family protein [Anaerolineales bacterium]